MAATKSVRLTVVITSLDFLIHWAKSTRLVITQRDSLESALSMIGMG